MSSIHELSQVIALPSLDIFSVPPTQASIEKAFVTEHRPISTLDTSAPIEFMWSTAPDEYVDFSDSMLSLKLKIKLGKDKAQASDWRNLAPVNNLLHSIFSEVELAFGDNQSVMVYRSYPYKAYFETLLGYGRDAKKSYMETCGWIKDETDDISNISGTRRNRISPPDNTYTETQTIDLIGSLFINLGHQDRLLLGGMSYRIKLKPNDPNFYIHCIDSQLKPSVEFIDASFYVSRVKVSNDVVVAHRMALRKGPAKFPITRGEIKKFILPADTLDTFIDNAIIGQIPRRIFLAFTNNLAVNSDLSKNPFDFKHYNVNFIACYINGEQFPTKALTPDFKNKVFSREYMELFRASNQMITEPRLLITKSQFANSFAIFAINLAGDKSDGSTSSGHVDPIKHGNLRLELHFKEKLPHTVTVLMYAEYDNLIQINENGSIITDFN